MSRRVTEAEELKTMINSFRCSDLVSLLGFVGRNRSGRKNELQSRTLEILKNPSADINIEAFKHKIKVLYKAAQDEAKQTHNLELQQQQMIPHNMPPGARMQHVMAQHATTMPPQRPMNNMNPYGVPSASYHHQSQRGNLASGNAAYQGGIGIGANAYPNSGFANQAVQPIQPMPSAPVCNFGNTIYVPTSNYFPQTTNVRFRKLPFYNIKHEILKPTTLLSNHHSTLPSNLRSSATQEFNYSFVLTCDMASDMAMNRDISNGKNEYNVQAQLRITAIDNMTNIVTEYDDFLPLGLVVRLNQRQCTLPMCSPNTRTGTESRRIPRPINITPHMKMSPISTNTLIINWALETGKTFVASVNLVEKLSSEYLLNKLKERPTISVDVTKATIRQQYKRIDDDDDNDNSNADDDDIATTIVRVSLVCPLAKFRMMYPAKGKNCTHLQCFDGSAYISLNEKKPMWNCPVCNRPLYFDDLLIDQYFLDVLHNEELPEECQEVQLLVDGTWKSYDEEANNEEKPNNGTSASSPAAPSPSRQDVNHGDSNDANANDEEIDRKDPVIEESDVNSQNTVVDLTEEDEESPENAMEVSNDNVENQEASKSSPPTPSTSPVNQDTNDEKMETNVNNENKNTESTNSTAAPTTASISAPSEGASSTAVSSSGCISPSIISLDSPSDSPSPPLVNRLNIGVLSNE